MIGAGEPERLEGVTHVERARDIRRRDDHREWFLVGVGTGLEETVSLPTLVPALL
jgi:hypothetical protein